MMPDEIDHDNSEIDKYFVDDDSTQQSEIRLNEYQEVAVKVRVGGRNRAQPRTRITHQASLPAGSS
jgi:hypothetical protein